MKYVLYILLAILLAVVGFFSLLLFGGMPIHNWKLSIIDQRFIELTHPTSSRLLAHMAEISNYGNSNHCDYAVGEIRTSSDSKSAIEEYYKNKRIESLVQGPIHVETFFLDELDFYNFFPSGPFLEVLAKYSNFPTTTERRYLVLTLDPMNPATFDARCH